MNENEKLKQFVRIARSIPSEERVPLAFEKRIMSRLAQLRPIDAIEVWGRIFWRVAACGLGVALLAAAWTAFHREPTPRTQDLANDLDKTILAPFGSLAKPS